MALLPHELDSSSPWQQEGWESLQGPSVPSTSLQRSARRERTSKQEATKVQTTSRITQLSIVQTNTEAEHNSCYNIKLERLNHPTRIRPQQSAQNKKERLHTAGRKRALHTTVQSYKMANNLQLKDHKLKFLSSLRLCSTNPVWCQSDDVGLLKPTEPAGRSPSMCEVLLGATNCRAFKRAW